AGDALLIKRFDTVDSGRGVEMFVVTTLPSHLVALRRFFQVQFESVEMTDRVKTFPRLTEFETELLVIANRSVKIVHKKLRSKRCESRFCCCCDHLDLQLETNHLQVVLLVIY